MFLSGRVFLFTILISFYVFKVYLIRPYVDIFLPYLDGKQLEYIYLNNFFFNPHDAGIVYISLFSLLLAWLLGTLLVRSKPTEPVFPLRIFKKIDAYILNADWRFWLIWVVLTFLNYKSPSEAWEGMMTGESSGSFGYGLFSPYIINFICLYAFILLNYNKSEKRNWLLILPVISYCLLNSAGGSRSAVFIVLVMASSYWFFLNFERRLSFNDLKKITMVIVLLPLVIFAGLFAQVLRPLLRAGADPEVIWETAKKGFNLLDSNNAIMSTIFFGLTELLHRLSSLQAQFLILNDHFIHPPWETFNPWNTVMRIFNDLMPGDPFSNLLTINQLYDYIYHDALINYNSETWGIQGTLYLYFGYWFSPIVVFCVACLIARYYPKISFLAKHSPSVIVFFILLFNDLIENGTFERVIPNDIVRPLVCFFTVSFFMRVLKIIFPSKLKRLRETR
ncbi:hypothetical protein K1X76_03510 [bacterium]|nr:hypothetical protein [bacterium]